MRQATLGYLISRLERMDSEKSVRYDFVNFRPKGVHNYRGAYEQLAIGYEQPDGKKGITVNELRTLLQDANGKTFTGYWGGSFKMHEQTPLWVANRDESGGTAVVDVRDDDWIVTITTTRIY